MMNINCALNGLWTSLSKNAPTILVGAGITGMVTSTVLAVKETPNALKLIEQKKKDLNVGKLTISDTVKVTAKCYTPATIVGITSVICIVGGTKLNLQRTAALAAGYHMTEQALTDYKKATKETIGENKEKEIQNRVDKNHMKENPVSNQAIIVTEKGNTLCYDSITGKYFKSDINEIKKAINELNRRLIVENYISLNEFYYELDIDQIGIGDELGWNLSRDDLIDISFGSQIADDGTPCIVLNYSVEPRVDYAAAY